MRNSLHKPAFFAFAVTIVSFPFLSQTGLFPNVGIARADEIGDLIKLLNDETYEVRQNAETQLAEKALTDLSVADDIAKRLRKVVAANNEPAERQARAKDLLRGIV